MQESMVCVYCSSPCAQHAELIDYVISCLAVIRCMYLNEHVYVQHQEVTADIYVQVYSV